MTLATQAVLRVLLDDPSKPRYGFDVAHEAGLATGSLYPILSRLEKMGWIKSFWEQSEDVQGGRPRRRYYELTADGAAAATSALEASIRRLTPRTWQPSAGIA